MQYRLFRTSAAHIFVGGLPLILLTYAFQNKVSAVNHFNSSQASILPCAVPDPGCVAPALTGDFATFGPGFWLFLCGVAIGTIAGAFHYQHQRLVSEEYLLPPTLPSA